MFCRTEVTVKLPDCFNPEAVDSLLNLFYTGKLAVNHSIVNDLFAIAGYLKVSFRLNAVSVINVSDLGFKVSFFSSLHRLLPCST